MKPNLVDKNIIQKMLDFNKKINNIDNIKENTIFFNFIVILLFIIFILFLIFRYLEKKNNIR